MQTRLPSPMLRSTATPALVPAVSRALALLERLAQRREPMSLARPASELALPRAACTGCAARC